MNDRLVLDTPCDIRDILVDLAVVGTGLGAFLEGLAELASSVTRMEACRTLASVTLLRPRRHPAVAGSSRTARRLADLQQRFDDGPGVRAAQSRKTVVVDDLEMDPGFPVCRSVLAGSGIRSVLSVPVDTGGLERATVTYFSRNSGAFGKDAVLASEEFARAVSTPLKLALRVARLTEKVENLTAAMESRTTIDLAAGIVMAQNRCSQDDAIEILRAASSARNLKLRDLAGNVLRSTVDAPVSTHFD